VSTTLLVIRHMVSFRTKTNDRPIQSFGNIIASGIAGLLWSLVSPTAAFVYLAVWAALAMLVLGFLALSHSQHRA
jgi:hypothetical protein